MKIKHIIKPIIFIVLFSIIFGILTQIFKQKLLSVPWNTTIKVNGIYNEKKDSYDIMFGGTSHMYCSIIPRQLEEETGVRGYTFTTSQQPMWITYFYIEEFLKYQSPKLIVLDVRELALEDEYAAEGTNRTALDNITLSDTKIQAIKVSIPKKDRASYYFSFIKYHSRWKELKKSDFSIDYLKQTDSERGYVRLTSTTKDITPIEQIDKDLTAPIPAKSLEYLERIVKLLNEKGIELLLIKSPSNPSKEEQMLYNSVDKFANENGIKFINYNLLYDEIGIDINKDFYDKGHLNETGAKKFTTYFGNAITNIWNN
jgi:hypothetical protein